MSDEEKKHDKLSKALGLEPFNFKKQLSVEIDNTTDDIVQAKDNIKQLIAKGKTSLDDLLSIASQSEHPRAFEVASNFIKALVDANRELVDINIRENGMSVNNDNRQVHNNNIFVGSTAELLQMMKNQDDDGK